MTSPVSLKNIFKAFNSQLENRLVFEDLTLEIESGERVGIVGPNGSGKSTLVKILLGQMKPDKGSVKLGVPFSQLAYIPQDYRNALFPWLTIRSNLSLLLKQDNEFLDLKLGNTLEEELHYLLAQLRVVINIDKYPYQLSGGEQQALLLVQSVLKKPRLLIADEPFSAIDFHKKEIFEDFFSAWIKKNNITTLIVSHDIEQSVYLSSKIIVLTRKDVTIKNRINIPYDFPRVPEIKIEGGFRQILNQIKTDFE